MSVATALSQIYFVKRGIRLFLNVISGSFAIISDRKMTRLDAPSMQHRAFVTSPRSYISNCNYNYTLRHLTRCYYSPRKLDRQ